MLFKLSFPKTKYAEYFVFHLIVFFDVIGKKFDSDRDGIVRYILPDLYLLNLEAKRQRLAF
jgi:hypothetical protein